MSKNPMQANTFIRNLAKQLRRQVLENKLLAAPSDRVGRQWLDQAAWHGAPVANIRPVTMSRLLRNLAEPGMKRLGLHHGSENERLAAIREAFAALGKNGNRYFSRLRPSLAVLRMLDKSIADLEEAGITDAASLASSITLAAKADEFACLWQNFAALRREKKWIAPGQLVDLALDALENAGTDLPLLFMPQDCLGDLHCCERKLWQAWPQQRQCILPVDKKQNATLRAFVADSVLNEAREVFRIVAEENIPLDQVEAVTAAPEGAAALCWAALEYFHGSDGSALRVEDLPLTLAEGIPGYFSRPVRLVEFWLNWLRSDQSLHSLAAVFASGLLARDRLSRFDASPERIAMLILGMPGSFGIRQIVKAIRTSRSGDDASRKALTSFCSDILTPLLEQPGFSGETAAVRILLQTWAETRGEFDNYATMRLLEDPFLAGQDQPWPDLDLSEWLTDSFSRLRLMGKGPQPGKLHISGLNGGYSGRPALFVTGLDEGTFPGGDRQDPVFLDDERKRLSPELRLSAEHSQRRENDLALLLSRSVGRVYVSYPAFALRRGQELFPAETYLRLRDSACRTDSVDCGSQDTAVFVPKRAVKRLSSRENWLGLLLSAPGVRYSPEDFSAVYPNLADGQTAVRSRASGIFTKYDCFVPEAGDDYRRDPTVMSASRLEVLHACPAQYFFRYVLALAAPERGAQERMFWLSAADRGSLMHRIFKTFLAELRRLGERVDAKQHWPLFQQIASNLVGETETRLPPADKTVFLREQREIMDTGRIFLQNEEILQKDACPLYFEASFGTEDRSGDLPWGDGDALELILPLGKTVKLQGVFDRIDRLDAGGLAIWDYKTGSSSDYKAADPFHKGKMQAAVYAVALANMPGNVEPVAYSGYYFPLMREGGKRVRHRYEDLTPVLGMVSELIIRHLDAGFFPAQPLPSFKPYDFAPLYESVGGLTKLAQQADAKETPLFSN